jgi:hypothetical protein
LHHFSFVNTSEQVEVMALATRLVAIARDLVRAVRPHVPAFKFMPELPPLLRMSTGARRKPPR